MQIAVLTLGTRGDLALFVALGRELRRRGHRLILGTSSFYSDIVRRAGLEWAPIGNGTWEQMLRALRIMAGSSDLVARTLAYYQNWIGPELAVTQKSGQLTALVARADYFLNNLKLVVDRGGRVLPGAVVTYDLPVSLEQLARFAPQQHQGAILDLVALSQPLFDPTGAWGSRYYFTGFWVNSFQGSASSQPTAELAAFLAQGPPPVVVTLGSMIVDDMDRFLVRLEEALRRCGQRAVLVCGWSSMPMACSSGLLHSVPEAPYDWLFPRACCVIHHGSYGATAAALLAGKPSIVLPQIVCQEMMGQALLRAHLATGLFQLASFAPDALAQALERALNDPTLCATVSAWQEKIASEPGVARAADLIEAHYRQIIAR